MEALRAAHQLPDELDGAPLNTDAAVWILAAFWELNTCRPVAMGFGPIPWTAIVQYAEHHRLASDVFPAFVAAIRTCDNAWLDWQRERSKRREREVHLQGEAERGG